MALFTKEEALEYHRYPRRGKLEVLPVKPCAGQKDLSMAYSPGVAEACKAIAEDADAAALYTGRSNLVAVVSDGSAVLGLGDIGPLAGKPVMEGKGVLFKYFADIDVFDINLKVSGPDQLIDVVKTMEPTFGGINLEDIKAPECFHIEKTLKEEMGIPVFHDDQHGTAVISGAGLLNAAAIFNRKLEDMKVVVVGAGAAGIACARFYVALGIASENIFMFDSRGLTTKNREGLNEYKKEFAQKKEASLAECMKGADMFLGLSRKDLVSKDMVRSMCPNPIIFAMANPDPEISYLDAKDANPHSVMGTGRTDYPNQVNNVSGFPYIFRGALDTQATEINEEMKLAAARSLAELAREPVPVEICDAYGVKELTFGIDYVIPKPVDPRIIEWETTAVARAAMESGVAKAPIADLDAYARSLRERLEASHRRINALIKDYAGQNK